MWLIWGNGLIFSREFKSYLPIYRYQSMWAVWFSPVQNCASFISRVIIILCHWGIACFVFNAKAISSVIICTFSQDNKATNVNFHACKTSQNLLEMTEVKSDHAYDSKHLSCCNVFLNSWHARCVIVLVSSYICSFIESETCPRFRPGPVCRWKYITVTWVAFLHVLYTSCYINLWCCLLRHQVKCIFPSICLLQWSALVVEAESLFSITVNKL